MPALDKNVRKLPGANAVTRPVDELTDTALIHFVWNFGKAQDGILAKDKSYDLLQN
jgi:hypothetical protein